MKTHDLGETSLGLPIFAYEFGEGEKTVLILGGVHGDEAEGGSLALALLRYYQKNPSPCKLLILPLLNLDGVLLHSRCNYRNVDLNRNLASKDWQAEALNERYPPGPFPFSESENLALKGLLESFSFSLIISLHSYKPCLNVNGACLDFARDISLATQYEIVEEIGYPTPGCLGTYCARDLAIPTLTYEVERGMDLKAAIALHLPAITSSLERHFGDSHASFVTDRGRNHSG